MDDYIIIPTYNEHKNISLMLDLLTSMYPRTHIMVVDDNSPDGTAETVRDYSNRFPRIELYARPGKFGLGTAYTEAFGIILQRSNVRSLTTLDADFSHDPINIGKMHELIDTYDLVIGSRYVKGGRIVYWPLWRRILSRLGNLYARTVTRTKLSDMTSGFQCFRAELLRRYNYQHITSTGFAFLMEMKIIAYRMGARIKEIPIALEDRKQGKSKLSNHIIYEGIILPWRWFIGR